MPCSFPNTPPPPCCVSCRRVGGRPRVLCCVLRCCVLIRPLMQWWCVLSRFFNRVLHAVWDGGDDFRVSIGLCGCVCVCDFPPSSFSWVCLFNSCQGTQIMMTYTLNFWLYFILQCPYPPLITPYLSKSCLLRTLRSLYDLNSVKTLSPTLFTTCLLQW